jgi:Phage tail lysozyme
MAIGQFASGFADAFERSSKARRLRDVIPIRAVPGTAGSLASPSAQSAQGGTSIERSSRPVPRDPAARQTYAMGRFNGLGWKPHQAAAIVGGLMQESGASLDPNATGDKGTAHGIAQVRGIGLQI